VPAAALPSDRRLPAGPVLDGHLPSDLSLARGGRHLPAVPPGPVRDREHAGRPVLHRHLLPGNRPGAGLLRGTGGGEHRPRGRGPSHQVLPVRGRLPAAASSSVQRGVLRRVVGGRPGRPVLPAQRDVRPTPDPPAVHAGEGPRLRRALTGSRAARLATVRCYKPGSCEGATVSGVAVLTCMDPRVNVRDFGAPFRGAYVLRNAGGRATQDVVRSCVVAWRLADAKELAVVHHTDCRMMTVTDDKLRDDLANTTGADVTGMEFLTFTDLRGSVEQDVERLSKSRYLATVPVSGFVWDLGARQLQPVVIDRRSRFAGRTRGPSSDAGGRRGAGRASTTIAVPTGGIWASRRP